MVQGSSLRRPIERIPVSFGPGAFFIYSNDVTILGLERHHIITNLTKKSRKNKNSLILFKLRHIIIVLKEIDYYLSIFTYA